MNLVAAEILANELMEKHGLTKKGWEFKWSRGKRQFGVCRTLFRKGTVRKEIVLSRILTELNDEEQVKDVILHEIAHAIAGHQNGHNHVWKQIARSIGAKPERCFSKSEVNVPSHSVELVCGDCDNIAAKRHRKPNPQRLKRLYCTRCGINSVGKLIVRKVA